MIGESRSTRQRFHTTDWSVVAATRGSVEQARSATASLCESYWYPLYAFARRLGVASHDAADAVQGFLADVLERGVFRRAQPGRGRFRAFLATSFRHWLAHERAHRVAQKRGGRIPHVSIDEVAWEQRFSASASAIADPEQAFLRDIALQSLDAALRDVATEYGRRGQSHWFQALERALSGDEVDIATIARQNAVSEGAVRVALHRLRSRFREALRKRVTATLRDGEDVEAELNDWFASFSQ